MNKKPVVFIFVIGLAAAGLGRFFALAQPAADNSPQAMFYRGNEYMRAGDFVRAVATYEEILRRGVESGALYYNLGNAYVKQGKLGKALVNYERSRRLMPNDSDLKANREYVKTALASRIPETKQLFAAALIRRISSSWTLGGLITAAAYFYWLLCSALLLRILLNWQGAGMKTAILVLTCALLACGVIAGVKYYDERIANPAIIIVSQTDARYGPSDDATVYFRLYEGTPVQIMQGQGTWLRVKTPDAKFGWIPGADLEPIEPPAAS